jgi:hypothetical protein
MPHLSGCVLGEIDLPFEQSRSVLGDTAQLDRVRPVIAFSSFLLVFHVKGVSGLYAEL